jgi:CRISPR-associated protein Cas1
LRDRINKSRLLERCTADIKKLLRYEEFALDDSGEDEDWAGLQTDGDRVLDGGHTYADEPIW